MSVRNEYRRMAAEDERAVLEALRAGVQVEWSEASTYGFNAVQLYGWAPFHGGWSVKRARGAARRLENRGELIPIPGHSREPRRWKLPEPADG